MPMLKALPSAFAASMAGRSAAAEIGCTGLPSAPVGIPGFIRSQTAFETVMALPFRSIESGVTIWALVP